MSNGSHRKRGGTFHLEDLDSNEENDHNVQFVTPYYEDPAMPEPLDLSKLCLDDDLFEKEDNEEAAEKAMEEMQTRGRSRSRSVHENDLAATNYIPTDMANHAAESADKMKKNTAGAAGSGQPNNATEDKANRRGGPLQQREVQALKKGLEEANQSINRNQNREDEEERMAADAEKRKRLLLSNNNIANNNAATATRRVKLLMLGDSGVGKSSLILRWTLDAFSPSLVSTVGVNFKSRKVNIANEAVQVQVWDTAGQEQFHKITTSYYKGAQGIMLVYDVTDPASLANIEYWIKNIKSHASDTVQVALIGNKTDLRAASVAADPSKKCCETERGQEIAHKFGIPFFETSAKESSNVEIAFLTLVEHIMESGGGGAVAGHSPPGHSGLSHQPGQAPASSGAAAGGLSAARSIVEKAGEKARMFGAFKRQPSGQNAKGPVPPPPAAGGANAAPGAGAAGAAQGAGADGATGEDKEKCIIS